MNLAAWVRWTIFGAVMGVGCACVAQTRYACPTGNGTYVASSRPCSDAATGQTLQSVGPQTSRPNYGPTVPRSGAAPEYLKYMGARCSSLHDAIRTGAARGVHSQAAQDTQRAYQNECRAEEAEAMGRLSAERGERQMALRETKKAQEMNREQAQAMQQMCAESKRLLFAKRARTDLNEGEKSELKRFEENYRARCG